MSFDSASSPRSTGSGSSHLPNHGSVQADTLRVSGKNRDDLQEAIAFLKQGSYGLPLQFENFRD